MESWVQSWRPCTNAFCDFSTPPDSTCLKYCACHEKSEARSYEVLHPSRKIIFPKLKIWCSKMQPLSGNQRPDLLTSLMNMSLAPRLRRKMHLCRSSAYVPRLTLLITYFSSCHKHAPGQIGAHVLKMACDLYNFKRLYTLWSQQLLARIWKTITSPLDH